MESIYEMSRKSNTEMESRRVVAYNWGEGFPGGSVVKNPPANAGDVGSVPGSWRSSEERNGSPLQHSCLRNPTDKRSLVGYSPWGRKELGMT